MSEHKMPLDQLAQNINAQARIAKTHYEKGEGAAKSAGYMLSEARDRCDAGEYDGGKPFIVFVARECKFSIRWAYKLIAVANGQTTYEAMLGKNAERNREWRAKKKGGVNHEIHKHQAPDSQGEKAGNSGKSRALVKQGRGRPPKGSLFDEAIRELTKVARTKTYEQVLAIVKYAKEI